jgi:hypothetical protein
LIRKKFQILFYLVISFIAISSIISCRSTKFVPDDKYLLQKYKIKCDNKSIKTEDLDAYIKQSPNRKILNIVPYHLWLYNFINSGKSKNWKQKLGNIVGESPVVLDDYLTKKSISQLKIYLNHKGFHNALVYDTMPKAKNKKAKVHYIIKTNEPYKINNINYVFEDENLKSLILEDTINSLINKKEILDYDILQNERLRITQHANNNGYYFFVKEYVYFIVDSALNNNKADLIIGIKKSFKKLEDGTIEEENHSKYNINNIYVYSDFNAKKSFENKDHYKNIDTILFNNIYYLNESFDRVIPKTISDAIYISKNEEYNKDKVNQTYKALLQMGQFKLVNIKFIANDSLKNIDCLIQLSPFTLQSYTLELEGTNTSGNFGVAGNILYQHKSLFKRGELFDLKFKGAIEAQSSVEKNVGGVIQESLPFNTIEFGVEGKINFPKFLLPIRSIEFVKKYRPKTAISTLYNFQKRPDYTRSILNISFGYNWQSSNYLRHVLNPIEVNSVKLFAYSEDFLNSISNPFIKETYTDHLITSTSYSLIFNTQRTSIEKNFIYLRFNAESAGNLLSLSNTLLNNEKNEGSYKILGEKYTQFLKTDFDIRRYNILNSKNRIVTRFFGGIAYPYSNSNVIPFEKKYFAGGANSIRAWQVRALGPGSYIDSLPFPNQLGDIKLEANIEYRFKLFWLIEGALFLDIGNIWAINNSENRQGAVFEFDRFYKEFAVGTGFGTRFDFSFFVFRIDIGIKLRDPELTEGNRWIVGNRKYLWNDLGFNLGIGYPF